VTSPDCSPRGEVAAAVPTPGRGGTDATMASMDLSDYVDALRNALTTAAAAGGEQARETARLLADTMEPAVRLAVIDAMSAMAAEVTAALEGSLVDIRLRGGDPEVVVLPGGHEAPEQPEPADGELPEDDGSVSRISLRLPDSLKSRAEAAAASSGVSLNAWLVRAVAAALREPRTSPPGGRGPRRYSGFARS
jgi:HicB-like protein involved in pilus formation